MTTIQDHDALRPAGRREMELRDLLAALTPLLRLFRPARADGRAAKRELARLSDHLLRDIGLERMPSGAVIRKAAHSGC
jgi:uncharacterized protein YjiS (DUF1127 family)